MSALPLRHRVGPERTTPALLAAGTAASCVLVALVDPSSDAPYPACPTRTLLGIDCPACGTLRGLHAAAHGNLGAALSHNLLLAVAMPVGALIWLRWFVASLGRPAKPLRLASWVLPVVITVAAVYAVARNLPFDAVAWLDSA